jgi:sugar phosphate isomerase/epimerase
MIGQILSLAPQTFSDLPAADFVRLAAEAGYSNVGLRVIATNPRNKPDDMPCLIASEAEAKTVKGVLDSVGISASELESIALTDDLDLSTCRPGFEIGAMLGTRFLLMTIGLSDLNQSIDVASEAGLLAKEYGMMAVIEFIPWRPVGSFDRACEIATKVDAVNVGVLIDSLHFDRVGAKAMDIARYDACLFPYVQLCYARAERPASTDELMRQAFSDRMYPGEGGLDLVGILQQLRPQIAVSVEVPNQALTAQVGRLRHAVRAREATEALINRADARSRVAKRRT